MKQQDRQTIMITGALGHIGSSLIRHLVESNGDALQLYLVDNLESQRYATLFNLPKGSTIKFFEKDIRDADMDNLISNVDIVIHLAAITNAEASIKKQVEVESVNFDGLKRVADACLKHGVKILFPSTTSVYGSQDSVVDEGCEDLKPQSPYADSKLKAEEYLRSMHAHGLEFVICRFGTIFGYSIGMRFHTAVNKFIWQAVNGLPITVWKTAWNQRRPYLDLQDCVRAIDLIIKKEFFIGDTYNVLTKNFTVEDIVTTIKKYAPNLSIEYVDSKIMNQLSYDVDGTRFNAKGFVPQGDLDKALHETFEKLKQIRQ